MAKAQKPVSPRLFVSEEDFDRLSAVVERYDSGRHPNAASQLDAELARAQVLPKDQMPPNVVTMRSKVVIKDLVLEKTREFILSYPEEANAELQRLSILAPVGLAVLGLRVGDEIEWELPGGETTTLKVLSISFQPEAEGRFDL